MDALMLSLLSALFLSINAVVVRKALMKVNPLKGTFVSATFALVILTFFSAVNGDFSNLYHVEAIMAILLGFAGVLHLTIGQTLYYYSTKIVGASRGQILISTNLIYAAIFSFLILGEALGIGLIIGITLTTVGICLTSFGAVPSETPQTNASMTWSHAYGILFGLVGGAVWGLTSVLVKVGMVSVNSPSFSNFISYSFAVAFYPMLLVGTGNQRGFRDIDKKCLIWLLVSGAVTCVAQVFRYSALQLANVSFVAPIISISPLFTVLFSYFFIQKIEMINLKTVIGTVLAVLGLYAIIFS